MSVRRELRTTFDRVAELYDQRRPTYPEQVFDDLVELAGLRQRERVLEIGCGTGQATVPMARRGYRIVAVELGANLASIARRNLAAFPNATVEVGAFEEWAPPAEPFDAVMAFTSFHWLDAEVALPKIASLLRSGGALAITKGGHIGGTKDDQFFAEVQACYVAHDPTTREGVRLQHPDEIPLKSTVIEDSGLFGPAQYRRYVWHREFTTASYIGELNTYSGHIALSEENRSALLACIAKILDERYGGAITKAYLTDLVVARTR